MSLHSAAVMDVGWTSAVLTVGLGFLTLHGRNHGSQLKSLMAWAWKICRDSASQLSPQTEQQVRKAKIEKALWEVRARAYQHSAQFLVHLAAFGISGMLYALYMDPSMKRMVQVFFSSLVYLSHHSTCTGKVKLTPTNLRRIYAFFQSSFVLFVLANPTGDDGRAIITQGFNACSRMIMSVIFMDSLTVVPSQLAISLAETGVHAMQHTMTETIAFAWMQTLVCCSIIAFCLVLEFWVTSHISVLLDTENMVSSFRRMLRGVSDGEVLLNEEMLICEDADCLKHLLMTAGNFKGKEFERLLVPDEISRFQAFLKQSMAEAQKAEEERTKTPPCLRLSLRGSSNVRVGVDLWHVLVPGRKDGVLHMLALREDTEAKTTLPNATGDMTHPHLSMSPKSTTAGSDREPSEVSFMSQKSSTSLLQSFPEITDMTLCVDASTHWFDVEQAHLSFQRQPQSSDCSMPSLRQLVRRTDWETVRSKLKKVQESAGSEDIRLHLVDDAKRCMVAQAYVSTYKPPSGDEVKLCLQLTKMAFEDKSSRDWNLASINE